MDENYQVDAVETTETEDVTTPDFQDAFSDGWEDDGFSEVTEEAEVETAEATSESSVGDQHEAETAVDDNAAEAAEPEADKGNGSAAGDQRFTLKAYDEQKELDLSNPNDRNEAVTLMQKGMGYDKKVNTLTAKITEYEEFLDELIGTSGLTREQLIDSTRARVYQAREADAGRNISDSDALLKVQRDRASKRVSAEEKAQQEATAKAEDAEKRINEAVRSFISVYPEVKPTDIPKEVWDEVEKSGDLVGAYTRYENNKLKAEITALKQNNKNAARSTGSLKTAGSGNKKSPFDLGWDDI